MKTPFQDPSQTPQVSTASSEGVIRSCGKQRVLKGALKIALCAILLLVARLLRADEFADRAAELVRDNGGSLFVVEDKDGAGSGFICAIGGKTFAITNQHVLAGHQGATLTLLNRKPLKMGQAAAAVGHDIMSIAVVSDAKVLEVMPNVERNATIGDAVAVLGNAEGAQVIKPFVGKLVGIGPNLVEVSAEFVPGNSGSPIIHLKSGKVIGVATYATIRAIDSLTGTKAPAIRRFGYRLDSVKQWQPVNWNKYNEEFQMMQKIAAHTLEFAMLLRAFQFDRTAGFATANRSAQGVTDPAIVAPLQRYAVALNLRPFLNTKPRPITKSERSDAVKDLLAAIRPLSQRDIVQANTRIQYDFFRHSFTEEQSLREDFYKALVEILNAPGR